MCPQNVAGIRGDLKREGTACGFWNSAYASLSMSNRPDHTHSHGEFKLRYGHPLPFGASHVPHGVNFSIFSAHATACTLVLFERDAPEPLAEIPFPQECRLGQVWAMTVDQSAKRQTVLPAVKE